MGRSAHHRSEPGRCACRPKDSHRRFAPSRLAYREARHSAASTSCAHIARSGAKDRVRAPRVRSASATRVTRSACVPPEPGHVWYRIFQARKIEVEIGEWRRCRSRFSNRVAEARRKGNADPLAPAVVSFDEAQADDAPTLDDPSEVVTRPVTRRPERAEAATVIHVPAAARLAAVLDVRSSAVRFEHLSGAVALSSTVRERPAQRTLQWTVSK